VLLSVPILTPIISDNHPRPRPSDARF
jgi:hypothetical protein